MRRAAIGALLLAGCTTAQPAAAPPPETVYVTVEPSPSRSPTPTASPSPTPEALPAEPVYVAPDPATVAQMVRGVFRDRLGRDPGQDEMQWHIDWYMAEHRLGGDTNARWMEMFEREYAAEFQLIRDRENAEQSREIVQDGVDTLSCMSNPHQPKCDD